MFFPQFADGGSGGNWQTTLILANRSNVQASATVTFYDDQGAPVSMALGEQTGNQFTVNIPALGVAQFKTPGNGPVNTGWVTVQSDQDLAGIATFALFDASGSLISEVGAPVMVPLRSMAAFAEAGNGVATGIALANPNTNPADVTLILKDSAANEIERTAITLPPMGHLGRFVSELFRSALSESFEGRVEVISTQPIVALTLRQKGMVFTSLPVIP